MGSSFPELAVLGSIRPKGARLSPKLLDSQRNSKEERQETRSPCQENTKESSQDFWIEELLKVHTLLAIILRVLLHAEPFFESLCLWSKSAACWKPDNDFIL